MEANEKSAKICTTNDAPTTDKGLEIIILYPELRRKRKHELIFMNVVVSCNKNIAKAGQLNIHKYQKQA